jgi:uncharacterized protein YndB with AHSA1/START domain
MAAASSATTFTTPSDREIRMTRVFDAPMEMRGVYREITPPERLVNTESWGGAWPQTMA